MLMMIQHQQKLYIHFNGYRRAFLTEYDVTEGKRQMTFPATIAPNQIHSSILTEAYLYG